MTIVINQAEKLPFRFIRSDSVDLYYNVYLYGIHLGEVYHDPFAWSYRPWFISGVKQRMVAGGVNQRDSKPSGYGTRYMAARRLAIMRSADIVAVEE